MRKCCSIWAVAVALGACTSDRTATRPSPPDGATPDAARSSVASTPSPLGPLMDRARVPGLAIATVRRGVVSTTRGFGLADAARGIPVVPSTIFATASISKLVTAASVMQLVETGKLALDEDVSRAAAFTVRNPAFPNVPITVRMLLAHVSSIADDPAVLASATSRGDPSTGLGDFLRAALTPPRARASFLDAAPRTTHRYSNVAVSLAALLVERRSGESFDAYSRAHVLEPLGIRGARWRLAELDTSRVAVPHRWIGTGYEPTGHVGHALYPVVDLRATAGEIATLLAAFANHGALGDARILRADTLARMLEPVAPALEPSQGLVFQRAELDGQTLWGHEGEDQGATTMAFFDPASGDGAVVLANGDAFASEDPARAEAMREILKTALR